MSAYLLLMRSECKFSENLPGFRENCDFDSQLAIAMAGILKIYAVRRLVVR